MKPLGVVSQTDPRPILKCAENSVQNILTIYFDQKNKIYRSNTEFLTKFKFQNWTE